MNTLIEACPARISGGRCSRTVASVGSATIMWKA